MGKTQDVLVLATTSHDYCWRALSLGEIEAKEKVGDGRGDKPVR